MIPSNLQSRIFTNSSQINHKRLHQINTTVSWAFYASNFKFLTWKSNTHVIAHKQCYQCDENNGYLINIYLTKYLVLKNGISVKILVNF
jgi:hypothetical protein